MAHPATGLPSTGRHLRLLPSGDGHQAELALDWQLPSGLPVEPPAPKHLRIVGQGPRVGPDAELPLAGMPPAAPWAARLARAVLEVVCGERPGSQLKRWTAPAVMAELTRRGVAASRHPSRHGRSAQCRRVSSVRVHVVTPTIVEASAVVRGEIRARAVALRLEAVGGRWLATAVEVG
ncbi:MAG: hypothetical protein EPO13_07995 [Actinomycetota bacterium]|nr:MAG: hypothetical protein EPO13_07995 [Actinomycetota bacterium]